MLTVIVDYDSGNLHSAQKAFERMANEANAGDVIVTSDPAQVLKADRVVLPGDGAYPACHAALFDHKGIFEAIEEVVINKARPFMGICIGMQMLATRGLEYTETKGFDWIAGTVDKIRPTDSTLKVPHMGWNQVKQTIAHPLWANIADDSRFYFVHSYYVEAGEAEQVAATCDYSRRFAVALAQDNLFAVQFHPEKSHSAGLQLLKNFVHWDGR